MADDNDTIESLQKENDFYRKIVDSQERTIRQEAMRLTVTTRPGSVGDIKTILATADAIADFILNGKPPSDQAPPDGS